MKAMILAAGLGTRLLPYTRLQPKPLFSISRRPVIDRIIRALERSGFESVIVNTHHLHEEIEAFLSTQAYALSVHTRFEPDILGTGGAIKNVADFWDCSSLLVINSDIVTDIDLKAVYRYHQRHPHPVTMVFVDVPSINTVSICSNGFVDGFDAGQPDPAGTSLRRLTFTGIQVLDPDVLAFIPESGFFSVIDAYRAMMGAGLKIKAFTPQQPYWKDIGTPNDYAQAVFDAMAPEAFAEAYPPRQTGRIDRTRLQGDGSDRKWYRLTIKPAGVTSFGDQAATHAKASLPESEPVEKTLIMADHGIRYKDGPREVDAFVAIGRHLYEKNLPVPRIYHYDTFSGLVFLEDLGTVSLHHQTRHAPDLKSVIADYEIVIDRLIALSVVGRQGFDVSWTCQTKRYDKALILEKECRYFVDAYLKGYLGLKVSFHDFSDAFSVIADRALEFGTFGFMHRDMQSRNIMVKNNAFYFIDFQGGRIGPIQYDLASLLIDPYVGLPYDARTHLRDYCFQRLSDVTAVKKRPFDACFAYCSVTRNLQILGAFAFLSRVRKKTFFESFIPRALKTLHTHLLALDDPQLRPLTSMVEEIVTCVKI